VPISDQSKKLKELASQDLGTVKCCSATQAIYSAMNGYVRSISYAMSNNSITMAILMYEGQLYNADASGFGRVINTKSSSSTDYLFVGYFIPENN